MSVKQPSTPRLLWLIIALYLCCACLYSATTPSFEGADEIWHYPVVHHLENSGFALPVLTPSNAGYWRQQAAQPPLYYLLAALITAPIDTSDIDDVRRLNPHELGVSYAGSVPNAVIHNAEREAWPWYGTVLALQMARGLSILFGLCTVLITYQLGRGLFPDQPLIALGAAALNATLPMFVLVSASVSNDALAAMLGNLLLLLLVRLLKGTMQPTAGTFALLGLVVGAGLLTKLSLGFGIPLVGLVLAWLAWRQRDLRLFIQGSVISGAVTLLVAGWWYWRNWTLYGDPTALNVFLDVVGRHDVDWLHLWSERDTLLQSTWGFVGAIYAPMPDVIYSAFNLIALVGLIGAGVYLLRRGWRNGGLWLALAWLLITLLALLRWSLQTPAWQGRLAFSALSVFVLLIALGLLWWLPRRWRGVLLLPAVGYFTLVTLAAPFAVIMPAFAPPSTIATTEAMQASFSAASGPAVIGLQDVTVTPAHIKPDERINLTLDWQIIEPADKNWSQFIHLVNPQGVIVAQRDLYPAINTLATSDLSDGTAWRDTIPLIIPETLYTPTDLSVRIGWYHLPTGQRMTLANGRDSLTVGRVHVPQQTNADGIPNPINLNFGGLIELIGYDISALSATPGDDLTLTLYWRALQPIPQDYVVFANIIDAQTLRKAAASNAMPANWTRPTSSWPVGEIIEDQHTLSVYPDAEAGVDVIEVGLYLQADGFPRLRLRDETGLLGQSFAHLTRVRIQAAA
jgi:4-amino-4-deoxy-L-arabinose transferase-like glycosyltransferase